jgi:hypothetical protein
VTRTRWWPVLVATVVATVAAPAIPAAAARQDPAAAARQPPRAEPVDVPSGQCTTLRDLGAPTIVRTAPIASSLDLGGVTFTLPRDATQGPKLWYLLRLHVSVKLAADAAAGSAIMSAATNGRTAAQIELKPSGAGLEWTTVSAAEPARRERETGRTADIRLTNFLQKQGVHGGPNTLTFHVEVHDGAVVAAVHVLEDTCLEATTRTPETLEVQTRHDPADIRAGDEFTVQARVRNTGTTPVGELRVTMVPDDDTIEPVGGTELVVRNLSGEWTGELRFRARSAGERNIRVNVGTAISPYVGGGTVAVRVAAPRSTVPAWLVGTAVAAVVLAFIATPLVTRRRPGRR